jgi:hypothetical protein
VRAASLEHGLKPIVCAARGHLYVGYDNVGSKGKKLGEKLGCISPCAEDLESFFSKNVNQTVSEDWLVLSHYHSDAGHPAHSPSLLPTPDVARGAAAVFSGPMHPLPCKDETAYCCTQRFNDMVTAAEAPSFLAAGSGQIVEITR